VSQELAAYVASEKQLLRDTLADLAEKEKQLWAQLWEIIGQREACEGMLARLAEPVEQEQVDDKPKE
jgi:hypothetical protein